KQEDLIDLIQFRFQGIRPEINDKIRSIHDGEKLTVTHSQTRMKSGSFILHRPKARNCGLS
ncbi:MAG: hypothetical protein ACE5PV_15405, partial [Candidatus Poribacteria bacterium]